jgi:hypothetical protein
VTRSRKDSAGNAWNAPRFFATLLYNVFTRSRKKKLIARRTKGKALCAAIVALASIPALSLAQQNKPKKAEPHAPPVKAEPAPELSAPFRAGEQLTYRVLWSKYAVKAANLQLLVTERRPFYGKEAWHFQARAHTMDTVRLLYEIDDQFDSYSSPGDLLSLQYEMYLQEQGKSETSVLRMSSERNPAPSPVPQVRVPAGTRDSLSFLQYLRQIDWSHTSEIRCPVFDGRKIYEARAHLGAARGAVKVPAGEFSAARIDVRVFESGQKEPTGTFGVWISLDGARMPVLIEAEIPFGTARVELTEKASGK